MSGLTGISAEDLAACNKLLAGGSKSFRAASFLLPRRIAAKHHRTQLRAGVFQRKIHVPTRLRPHVRHLAPHPPRAQPAFE